MKFILLFSILYCLCTTINAQVTYFEQDFSTSNSVSDYVDAGNPGSTKFTSISMSVSGSKAPVVSSYAIIDGAIQTHRPVDQGGAPSNVPGDPYAIYSTDFSPQPSSFYIQFSLDGIATTEYNIRARAVSFSIGKNFSNDATLPTNADTFTRLYVDVENRLDTLKWALHWISNGNTATSAYFTGKHDITLVLNRAGGGLSYVKPPPSKPLIQTPPSQTLANGKWDVWVDDQLIFDEIPAVTSTVPLVNFKFIHASGTGIIRLDDFQFRDVNNLLPLKLTNFRAVAKGGHVDLNWQLPMPDIGSMFAVERSRDGYDYDEISRHRPVPDQRYFGTTDAEPLAGLSYYRLRHINTDGSSTLTAPVAVRLENNVPNFSIRSNPSSGECITLITNNLPGGMYQLTTLTGQVLPCTTSETPDGQVTLLPQHRLPSGVYLLTATAGAIRLTRRVLVH